MSSGSPLAVTGAPSRAVTDALREELARDLDDVLAAVAGLRKFDRLTAQFARPRLHRQREIGDLHAGVVVVELARHLPPLGAEQVGERVAERRLARVAKVQRPGGIRRDELHHHPMAGVLRRGAETVALAQRLAHHVALGGGGDAQVDEAGSGDFGRLDQFGRGRVDLQRVDDGRGDVARVLLQAFRDLQRDVGGDVAVRLDLRPLQHDVRVRHAESGERLAEQGDELSFC